MKVLENRNLFTTSVAVIALVTGIAATAVATGVLPYKAAPNAQEESAPPQAVIPKPLPKEQTRRVHVASNVPHPPSAMQVPPPPVCANCGVIESIESFTEKGNASGGGAVAGGLLGGILGHQVGRGRGRDLATVAGAVGGAIAGNEIEKNKNKVMRYHVSVRMNDGTRQYLTLDTVSNLAMGGRVRVVNGEPVPEI